jgi:hypothetical protein
MLTLGAQRKANKVVGYGAEANVGIDEVKECAIEWIVFGSG